MGKEVGGLDVAFCEFWIIFLPQEVLAKAAAIMIITIIIPIGSDFGLGFGLSFFSSVIIIHAHF